jgi:hypothetical protein
MRVDPEDGRCRECGGELDITDADDATMTVECRGECGTTYLVETDAFGDGCMTYYVPFMAAKLAGGGDDDE